MERCWAFTAMQAVIAFNYLNAIVREDIANRYNLDNTAGDMVFAGGGTGMFAGFNLKYAPH
ncbi:hypothetical protein ACFGVR_10990 [Mucilaginibacter sp. AW1-3]